MLIVVLSAVLLAGMLLTGGVIIYILMDQHENSLREYAVLGLFCAILTMLSYYAELNIPGFAAKIDAVKFGYLGRVYVNPILLMLAARYYGARISKPMQALLYVIPTLTLAAVFRCEASGIYYKSVSLGENGLLAVDPGPLYYIYMGYNTVLAMGYIGFCLYQRRGLSWREKSSNTLLLFACLIPFLSLLAYLAGWTDGLDVSSVGVMIGALLIALAIFRFGLLNKDEMLQNMATGLVFLDNDFRLIYANRTALRILPALSDKRISGNTDLSPLCTEQFASIEVGSTTYQRQITEWSSGDGQHGKLLTFDDVTEIRARLNRDAMTGLYNHATFYPMLDQAMKHTAQSGAKLAVSIADIDSFKRINDNFGHANGDVILIQLAAALQRICGEKGDVFRYGGEEFAVIFHCGFQEAERIMQTALETFSAMDFDFLPYHVTFSYGSAEHNGQENSVMLFDRADQLMYTRKRAFHQREDAKRAAAEDQEAEQEPEMAAAQ